MRLSQNTTPAATETEVLITEELAGRPTRQADLADENQALHTLSQHLSDEPQLLLKTLVRIGLELCQADSAGISLLETQSNGESRFRWVAIAGALEFLEQTTTPGNFSPCGTTLSAKQVQLYTYPERYFTYLHHPLFPIVEGLLIPLYINNQPLGTLWIVSHQETRRFDGEDHRLMSRLAGFSASALQSLNYWHQKAENAVRQEQAIRAKLNYTQAQFEALVANVPGIVYRYSPCPDHPYRFTFFSSGCYELLELEAQTIVQDGNAFVQLIHPEDVDSFKSSVTHAVENFLPWRWEGRIITPSGKLKWIVGSSRAVPTTEGNAWDGILIDITNHKLAEAELRQSREEAQAANRVKDEFLAVLSHELRSPLNPILGWSSLLLKRKLSEAKIEEGLATIHRNAQLQSELIEDLLDVSRILRGKLNLNCSPVDLTATIMGAMETVQLAAQAKSITLQAALEPNIGQVRGDATRLQQVIWNLLSNAVKFTPPGGQVNIHLEQLGNVVQITVSDTGKGIAPDFLAYIFDYFRQEDGSITRKFGGLGLGLAIARHLVELHSGTIEAQSPGVDQGATFIIRLPLMSPQPTTTQDSKLSDLSIDLSGVKVLVVDDEPDTRELVAFVLEQHGASVTAACSAQEALTILNQSNFDVLLSDIGMPNIDGYMLIQQLRNLWPQYRQIKAIAFTAYAGEINQQQALKAGFDRHIFKPIEPLTLAQAISDLVRST
ncbi:multi-sensor hybrid histidine kinase (plasmid) [Trichormus variabilis ATCC 29413]|uniref:Circadian input-output histidine kinase CikA n=4 Tax=Nostocaceae TaxID=1162 RepID=A0A0M4SUN0_9NOSO|nr:MULTISPECIES: ATP-binding protein [Nostocaceae]ABA25244.1 multi-sensor hybrid histidine kinase [Trichormus variabilis ATCC 29413]ALF55302.1 histidine kinase [Nostoc piscinale CENA21]MBC1218340.1 response regulator [Trichormus variabilis ARAD]MBC1271134.1 response regulator [Trichormus variabilis FSR]MBC1305855.1 response regulator [Trichormus variabilis N2B]